MMKVWVWPHLASGSLPLEPQIIYLESLTVISDQTSLTWIQPPCVYEHIKPKQPRGGVAPPPAAWLLLQHCCALSALLYEIV